MGSPVQGYPAVILVLSTIPPSVGRTLNAGVMLLYGLIYSFRSYPLLKHPYRRFSPHFGPRSMGGRLADWTALSPPQRSSRHSWNVRYSLSEVYSVSKVPPFVGATTLTVHERPRVSC